MQADVFDVYLSYNQRYRAAAENLARQLTGEGLNVWIDTQKLKPGDLWGESAQSALANSRAMVVLVGQTGLSNAQEDELRAAMSEPARRIIPALLPGTPADTVPPYISSFAAVNFSRGMDDRESLYQLVAAIRGEPAISGGEAAYDEDENFEQVAQKAPRKKAVKAAVERPEIPTDFTSVERSGAKITVAQSIKGWRMEGIDGLVISAHYTLDKPGGAFYRALYNNLDRTTRKNLTDKLGESFAAQGTETLINNTSPFLIKLDEPWASKVLPFAAKTDKYLMVATVASVDGLRGIENIAPMLESIITKAGQAGITSLAMPILGSGQEDDKLGDDNARLERARRMIQSLLKITTFGSLKSITLLTLQPEIVDMARHEFNLFTNSYPQAPLNDQPGEDALNIEPEINALADAILLSAVEPPLAIGVLGGWGSGKSTVMGLMQKRIAKIRTFRVESGQVENPEAPISSAGAALPKAEPTFVGHVYMIKFNAWNYAKSNLWASLMQTIFFELNRQITFEQIFASRGLDPHEANFEDLKRENLLAGGDDFKKIFKEGYKLEAAYDNSIARTLLEDSVLWQTLRARKSDQLAKLQEMEKEIAAEKALRENANTALIGKINESMGGDAVSIAAKALNTRVKSFVSDSLYALVKTELDKENVKAEDIQSAYKTLQSAGATVRSLLDTVRQNPVIAVIVIVFFAVSLLMPFLWQKLPLNDASKLIGWLISAFTAVAPTIRAIASWDKQIETMFAEYKKSVDTELASLQSQKEALFAQQISEQEKEVAANLAGIEIIDQKSGAYLTEKRRILRELAVKNLAARDQYIALLEAQAAEERKKAGPTAKYLSLFEFVRSRLDGGEYENQLGLMHRVKMDIDELTEGLYIGEFDGEAEIAHKKKLFPRGTPRVVLFIDDLDRCPPSRVVEVLEAVQLLVNTRLFVIVLGLDTRYITRALEKEYKEILQHEGDPSGMDYIEKIIQIPYRVRPIDNEALQNYLRKQMSISEERITAPETAGKPGTGEIPAVVGQVTPTSLESFQTPEEDMRKSILPESAPGAEKQPEAATLPPEVVQFKPEDLEDLANCCSVVDLTPRSVKRLVNVLKLIKIFWFRRMEGDHPRPVKQAVVMMLALAAAYPEVMREGFEQISGQFRDPGVASESLLKDLLSGIQIPPALNWQKEKFHKDVQLLSEQFSMGNITLNNLGLASLNVVRSFSFVGDPSFWTDGSNETFAGSVKSAK